MRHLSAMVLWLRRASLMGTLLACGCQDGDHSGDGGAADAAVAKDAATEASATDDRGTAGDQATADDQEDSAIGVAADATISGDSSDVETGVVEASIADSGPSVWLAPLDFSFVGCGATATVPMIVPNTFARTLVIHAETSGPPFSVSPTDVTVGAGASVTFTLSATVPNSSTAGSPIRGTLSLIKAGPEAARDEVELSVTPNGATLTFERDLPTEANFGGWPVGVVPQPAKLVLKNTGNESVGVAIGSPANPAFTLTTQPAVPTTIDSIGSGWPSVLPANQNSKTLEVDLGFTPAAVRSYASTLPITTTGTICGSSVTAISLSGEGIAAGVYGWPEPDFNIGPTECGGTPNRAFTLKNSLNQDVKLTSLAFDKAGYTASVPAGTAIPADGQLEITIRAPPIPVPSPIPATYAATLTIATDLTGDAIHSFVVFSQAQGAIIEVVPPSPTLGTFGPSPYGYVATQTFGLANVGNVAAPTLGATETGPFGGFLPVSSSSLLWPPGASDDGWSVTFKPAGPAEVTGSLTFAFSTPVALCRPLPGPLTLSGMGYENGITVSPNSIQASTDCAGSAPGAQPLTINNVGFSAATWMATTTTGFALDVTGSTLAPGASATVTVTAPTPLSRPTTAATLAQGEVTVQAVFASDAGSSPDGAAPPTQTVIIPVLEAVNGCFVSGAPIESMNFGGVPVNSEATMTVATPTASCGFGQSPGYAELTGGGGAFHVVNNNGLTWTISFAPTTSGPQNADFAFVFVASGGSPICGSPNLKFNVGGSGVP